MKYIVQCLIVFLNISSLLGANILVFLPFSFHSHTRAYKPLFKELAQKGHNVTFYSTDTFTENIPNLKQVLIKDVLDTFIQKALTKSLDHINGWRHVLFIWQMGIYGAEALFQEPQIQELFHSTDLSFDVILLETFFCHEPFTALGHKFNAPIINLHPFRAEEWISDILRNPQPLAYIPNFRIPITENMSFHERILNVIFSVLQTITGHYYYIPAQDQIMRKYVTYPGSENLPPLLKLMKNTSLTFLDGNPIISFQSPLIPTFIPVGGIHIVPNKVLPKDVKKYMDESPNGVVYMSLGSLVKISSLPREKLNIIIKVLGRLPQTVLLKWESDKKMPGQPQNVLTSKWFPQLDILAHPNCRAFVTHGGIHSVLEAVYYGIPIVGLPVFIDQESNLIMARNKGYGEFVKSKDFNEESFSTVINKVLGDPSYKANAEKLSKILKDVPMSPLETAVFYVEHVIRHKGASHLQIAGTNLPWYQYYLIDIIFTALTLLIVVTLFLYKLVSTIFKFIFRRNGSIKKIKKNKKE